jgi:hypothetical protein
MGTTDNRYDIYAIIHKALRNFMFDTLSGMGSLDHEDDAQLAAALAQVRQLASACRSHLDKENSFVHRAMEARRPGSSAGIAGEHEHHERAIDQLLALANAAELTMTAQRARAVHQLYQHLAVFIGDNLLHMRIEETEHNAVLWSAYTDAELIALENELVASLPPEEKMMVMSWMLPAMTPQERAAKLAGIRAHAPEPVFAAVMEIAAATLSSADRYKLERDLSTTYRFAA